MSKSLESYAHKWAKRVVVDWLRDAAAMAGYDKHVRVADISWRVNRMAPHWGIWEEYPILPDGRGDAPVWDECDDKWELRPPTYQELLDMGVRPAAIIDVAIQHKGSIITAIEIFYKHPVHAEKLLFLQRLGIEVIELSAEMILGLTEVPSDMKAIRAAR